MASIFLSYSRADRPKAQIIAEALAAEGFEVWWDKVLRAGETYDEVTETRLRDADAVIVLWSTVSVKSKWVRAEATLGQRTSVLIPAMIEEAERPIMFELTQSADLIGWEGDRSDPRWKAFVDDARGVIGKPATPAPAAPSAAAVPDMTMELTFWTSIKDGEDAADFEAYLRRYPDGHYSDLARNRIAAIARKAASAAPAPAPPPPAPAPPPPPPPPPPPVAKVVAPPPKPAASAPPRPQPAPARAPAPSPARTSGSSVPLLIGGLIAIVAAGYGVSQLLPGKPAEEARVEIPAEELPAQEIAAVTPPEAPVIDTAPPETPPVETTAATVPEPAPPEPVCEICPPLVSLPGGTFLMGSPVGESGREPIEGPQREVTVKPFSISKTEITVGQWRACIEGGGCNGYRNPLGTDDTLPVAAISWKDAEAYAKWLSSETGKSWRLPTEAEWEYAARGGTTTPYWWGEKFDATKAPRDKVREAGSLPENTFGLQGMLGNVSEWTQDCYVNGYTDAPTDGSAVTSGDCSRRVVRGGSVKSSPSAHRAANRARLSVSTRDRQYGFRVVLSEN